MLRGLRSQLGSYGSDWEKLGKNGIILRGLSALGFSSTPKNHNATRFGRKLPNGLKSPGPDETQTKVSTRTGTSTKTQTNTESETGTDSGAAMGRARDQDWDQERPPELRAAPLQDRDQDRNQYNGN
ncbi:hypothetical protein DUI87_35563 [Hirundo rustica rustica]|uniref:Uncharacterized protein n=1 Tax=Hirundo rustica rustica TaxID=333673 RepID=A0A3M0IEW9_HIRRU|nr:hypothetical protein DUI87_35563 [Hirundo rustica rustica]